MLAEYEDIGVYDIFIGSESDDELNDSVMEKMLKSCVDSIDFWAAPCDGTVLGEPEFWGNDYAVYRFETDDAEYVITPHDERQLKESGFVIIHPVEVFTVVDEY